MHAHGRSTGPVGGGYTGQHRKVQGVAAGHSAVHSDLGGLGLTGGEPRACGEEHMAVGVHGAGVTVGPGQQQRVVGQKRQGSHETAHRVGGRTAGRYALSQLRTARVQFHPGDAGVPHGGGRTLQQLPPGRGPQQDDRGVGNRRQACLEPLQHGGVEFPAVHGRQGAYSARELETAHILVEIELRYD